MDIDVIIKNIADERGNDWPQAVVNRLVYLVSRRLLTDNEEEEYQLVYNWIVQTVRAGVAFRQESLIEH